jgi:acetyltransferase-like isoleucine patch superfamily enzyme
MQKIIDLHIRIGNKINTLLYKYSFKSFGKKSVLSYPFSINGPQYVEVGNEVFVKPNAWFIVPDKKQKETPLKLGSNIYIGRNAHFVALKNVQIMDDVLIADNVFISDNYHGYEDIKVPIKDQELKFKGAVVIGQQSWLGENVCVISASVGKHSVIGANSVVTSDIPDYCIAVGSHAKVIKRYDLEKKEWVKVNN